MPDHDKAPLALRKIPESDKPFWRQFWQNARGRADLKQVAGIMTLSTMLATTLILAWRTGAVPDSLIYGDVAIAALWYIGDAVEAVNVLKALYGGFRQPDVTNKNEIGGDATLNQGPGQAPGCNPPVSD